MTDDRAFSPVKSEDDIAHGLKLIGEALPELTPDEVEADPDDVTEIDEAYPSGLWGAVAVIVRDVPVKALVWAAGIGIAIGFLTSK